MPEGASYNIKLCGGALSSLTYVVPILRYNRFLLLPVKLNLAEDNRPAVYMCRRIVQKMFFHRKTSFDAQIVPKEVFFY